MELASAYPNSAISTGAMIAIALVAAGTLAFWLVMVFVADRQRRDLSSRRAGPAPAEPGAAGPDMAGPDETAEDEGSGADHGDVTRPMQPAGL